MTTAQWEALARTPDFLSTQVVAVAPGDCSTSAGLGAAERELTLVHDANVPRRGAGDVARPVLLVHLYPLDLERGIRGGFVPQRAGRVPVSTIDGRFPP